MHYSSNGKSRSKLESELWESYYETRSDDARNALVEKYLPYVRNIAHNLAKRLSPNVEADDLASAGVFGLIQAIEDYDLSRKVKFKSFSRHRIRGQMLDEIRRFDWIPHNARYKEKKAKRLKEKLIRSGRNLLESEIEEILKSQGLSLGKLPKVLNSIKLDIYPDSYDSFQEIETSDLIDSFYEHLEERGRLILRRHLEGKSYQKIGEEIGESRHITYQIYRRSILPRLRSEYRLVS